MDEWRMASHSLDAHYLSEIKIIGKLEKLTETSQATKRDRTHLEIYNDYTTILAQKKTPTVCCFLPVIIF